VLPSIELGVAEAQGILSGDSMFANKRGSFFSSAGVPRAQPCGLQLRLVAFACSTRFAFSSATSFALASASAQVAGFSFRFTVLHQRHVCILAATSASRFASSATLRAASSNYSLGLFFQEFRNILYLLHFLSPYNFVSVPRLGLMLKAHM
jgi:hypothetical protein